MATTKKSTEERGEGKINDVTVEVCRPAAGDKVPCVTVIYYGVRIIRYAISITEPEPAENITFEFDELEFQHYETDPATGEITGSSKTIRLENHHPKPAGTGAQAGGGGGGSSGSDSDATPSSGGGAGGVSPAPALAVAAAGGSPAAPGAAPDPTVNVNFPGLWQGTGFGILPD